MSAHATVSPRRGTELLLAHCAVLTRPPAAERLHAELGSPLARRLIRVLAPGQLDGRPGSSSP